MANKEKLCITGLSGRLGTILRSELAGDFDLTALNRRDVSGVKTIRADITRAETLRDVLRGQDVVLHLAAYPFDDDNWEQILPANLVGTYNLLEAARHAGARRFVFASSLSVLAGHMGAFREWRGDRGVLSGAQKLGFIDSLTGARPASVYGVSKLFGESLCRLYADRHSMSCVCLRLGDVRHEDRPSSAGDMGHAVLCRQRDFVEGVRRAVALTGGEAAYEVLTLISDDVREPR